MEPVQVEFKSGETLNGFIRWNDSWNRSVEDSKRPFNQQVVNFHHSQGRDSIQFFEELFIFGDHLPLQGFAVSSTKYRKLSINEISDIQLSESDTEKLTGAGQVTILEPSSIKLLEKEPLFYFLKSDEFSEKHFLSYNSDYAVTKLDSISKTRKLWLNRKQYEANGVILIVISWD